ncbi:alcohol dehydrogenase catalytic domain-containing protein [Phytohabitans sp. ZYX-F-186]|uniref:Alcohol dehydrogenase catalytic domain-containing protein n=1 Tax=Phytohabitans maris TaxID=3071409 RepID=A0ABU0ZEH1_9ACTN|nr:alcohol dehydrogenase catalytic domain-containing protein [Phytohabitans sp. ZYX-F-186]MDQ7905428.1 alcohol dehydrogenase catalytic domain-containing protein [Phytohabitans sp. ZYX-F-186]
MRAARLHGVRDVRVADEPAPAPGPDESLVKVTAVGLCGSDLHWYSEAGIGDARLDKPLAVGHEMAGVIEGGPRHGERVAIDPAIPCERCDLCLRGHPNLCRSIRFAGHGALDGGLREYMAWPTDRLHPLPDALSDADGAMLEPLGVALHSLDLAHLRLGMSVGVFGCGPIGLLLVQLARLMGARAVYAAEPLPHRQRAAEAYGASIVDNPAGLDVDVAFEVAGTDPAVEAAMVAAGPGARVVLVGIPDGDSTTFPASVARRKGLTIAMVRRMKDTYPRAIDLVRRGHVDVSTVVSDRYPLAAAADAFEAAVARRGLKVVVEPATPVAPAADPAAGEAIPA